MQVRRIEEQDRQAWERLFRAYIEFYRAKVPDEVIDLTWRRLLAGGEGNPLGLVAVDEAGVPFGLAHVLLHRSTWSATWYCYLEDLFVDPEARGHGTADALIRICADRCRERGLGGMAWLTAPDNQRAQKVYNRTGAESDTYVEYYLEL